MTRYDIRLPWTRPPLSLNDRGHWAARARRIKEVRAVAAALTRAQHIPAAAKVAVHLDYVPRDRRRRDEDNLVGTFKACCDGIVDAGVVVDDAPAYMVKDMPTISSPNPKDPHLVLSIEILKEGRA